MVITNVFQSDCYSRYSHIRYSHSQYGVNSDKRRILIYEYAFVMDKNYRLLYSESIRIIC